MTSLQRVELEPDAELADGLAGLDEGAPDVGVLDQALPVGDAGLLGVADRGGRAGLGRGDDQVGLDRVLARQPAAHLDPGLVHPAAVDRGVGTGQVDVLEDAALGVGLGEPLGAQAVGVDRDQLAGLDLTDQAGADDVEGRGLAGHHPAALEPAEDQGPDPLRVAGGVERVLVHEDEAERAAELGQDLQRRRLEGAVGVVGQQRGHQRRVGRVAPAQLAAEVAGEPLAVAGVEPVAQLGGVGEVAVVRERDGAAVAAAERRLGVLPGAGAGRGVAAVPDREVALERAQARSSKTWETRPMSL